MRYSNQVQSGRNHLQPKVLLQPKLSFWISHFARAPKSLISAAKRISAADNLDGHADVPWFRFRPILYNPYRDVWACRAFKRSFVVIRLIRLNAGQPHL